MNEQKYCHFCCMEIGRQSGCDLCGHKAPGKDVATVPEALPPGTILEYKYLVGRVLGRSDQAFTYLARDLHLQEVVTLKEYFPRTVAQRGPDGLRVQAPDEKAPAEKYAGGLRNFYLSGREQMRMRAQGDEPPVLQMFRANGADYLVMQYRNDQTVTLANEDNYQSILPVESVPGDGPVAPPPPTEPTSAPKVKKTVLPEERITGAKTGLKIAIAVTVLLLAAIAGGIFLFIAGNKTESRDVIAARTPPLAAATPAPMATPLPPLPEPSPTPEQEPEESIVETSPEQVEEPIATPESTPSAAELDALLNSELSGQITSTHIKQVLAFYADSMKKCYQNKPDAKGTVKLRFVIMPSGKVDEVILINTTVASAEIEQCLIGMIKAARFPAFKGEAVEVSNSFQIPN